MSNQNLSQEYALFNLLKREEELARYHLECFQMHSPIGQATRLEPDWLIEGFLPFE
ncbi:MAG: hypothetical protein ACAH95_03575 [Fimbriimonas sp.]